MNAATNLPQAATPRAIALIAAVVMAASLFEAVASIAALAA